MHRQQLTNQGEITLHVASERGHLDVVRYLIQECGVDATTKTNCGATAIMLAREWGHTDIERYLMQFP